VAQEIYEGRWNSGETAGAIPVRVNFEDSGLSIRDTKVQAQVAFWHYRDLAAGTPIGTRSGDVLLRNTQTPRATLFIEGPEVGKAVIARAPQTAQSAQRGRIVRYGLIVTALVLAVGAFLFFGDFSTSKAVAQFIPDKVADKMGAQGIEAFGRVERTCVNQPGNAALQRILDRLQSAGNFGRPFKLHVAKSRVPNAFALPGRHIVLLSGLVNKAKNPEEVAGVMAHEIGHGLELDPEAAFVRVVGMQTMLSLLTGESGNDAALTAGALLLQLRYSRDAERMADAHAIAILRRARIAPKPVGDFFLRDSSADSSADGSYMNYLSTHPSSKERAKQFQSQPPYATEPILTAKEWEDAQVICGEPLPSLRTPPKPKAPPQDRPSTAPHNRPKPVPRDATTTEI
jgi:Zn-dependent protease with chaperone function